MGDLQRIGNEALQRAPQPLRRALDNLGVQFRDESGPTESVASGSREGNIAGVEKGNPNTVSVMEPDVFRRAPEQLATHEGLHIVQNNWAPAIQRAIPPDNPKDPYNYGGTGRIAKLLHDGGTIANLPREQGAAALQYGQANGMPEPYKSLAKTIDDIPQSTIEMTDPMAKTLNMHPRAPQVPPSSTPGMNFANTLYQPGQPAPGDASLLPPDMVSSAPASAPAPDPLAAPIADTQQKLQRVNWHQANGWGSPNNHPGTMGKIAHVLSVAGNIAGDIVAPNVMANIPGTQLNMQSQHNGLTHQLEGLTQEQSENQSRNASTQATQLANAAEPGRVADTHAQSTAQTRHLNDEADNLENPQPDYEFQQTDHGLLRIDKKTGAAQPVTLNGIPIGPKMQTKVAQLEVGGKPHSELINENTGEVVKDLGETGEKPPQVHVSAGGTWTLAEDGQGKPILFNSKTGQTQAAPEGMQKTGTAAKAQAATAPVQGALDYATDYLNKKAYTGPGDEALQEKFFELAKPSTGFRMSQPQMDMLRNSASWMNSLEGKAHHALTGTWFSDKQRQQIVDTMNQLAQAKGIHSGANGPAGQSQQFTVNGKSYNIPANMVEEFKRDHPDAR